jgi:hypothetical protein
MSNPIDELNDVKFLNSKFQVIEYNVEDIRFIVQTINSSNADYTHSKHNILFKKLSDYKLLLIDTQYLFNAQLLEAYNITYDESFPFALKFDLKTTATDTPVDINTVLLRLKYNGLLPIPSLQYVYMQTLNIVPSDLDVKLSGYVKKNNNLQSQEINGDIIIHRTLNLNNINANGGYISASPGIYLSSFDVATKSVIDWSSQATGASGEILTKKDVPGFFINAKSSPGTINLQIQGQDAIVVNNDKTVDFKNASLSEQKVAIKNTKTGSIRSSLELDSRPNDSTDGNAKLVLSSWGANVVGGLKQCNLYTDTDTPLSIMTNFAGSGSSTIGSQNLLLCPSGLNYAFRNPFIQAFLSERQPTALKFTNTSEPSLCPFNLIGAQRNSDIVTLNTVGTNIGRFTINNPDSKPCLYEIVIHLTPTPMIFNADYGSMTVEVKVDNDKNYNYSTVTGASAPTTTVTSGLSPYILHNDSIRFDARPSDDLSLSNIMKPLHTTCYFASNGSKASQTIDIMISTMQSVSTSWVYLQTDQKYSWITIRHIS